MRDRTRRLSAVVVAFGVGLAPATDASATDDHRVVAVQALVDDLLTVVRAVDAGQRFLDRYVDEDGRVVRHDQGGDTVSEGQAYALTIAAAIGDEARFRLVWEWTQRELRRGDGLFSWRWAEGTVIDDEPAADADLLIAAALAQAAQRFEDETLAEEAQAVGSAVLEQETARVAGRPILVAGPWAVDRRAVNPSYAVLPAMSRLWSTGQRGWADVAASSRAVLDRLTSVAPHLPPDWATVTDDGAGGLRAEPAGSPPRYGWEAMRVPVQLAADCDATGRRIAARMWPVLASPEGEVATVYDLDGTVVDPSTHASALVGAAGAASAADEPDAATELLDRAADWDAERPTYYGAAWVALGRLWLTTSLLGGCAAR